MIENSNNGKQDVILQDDSKYQLVPRAVDYTGVIPHNRNSEIEKGTIRRYFEKEKENSKSLYFQPRIITDQTVMGFLFSDIGSKKATLGMMPDEKNFNF